MPNNEEETVVSCALSWHQNSTVFYKSPLNLHIRKKMCMNAKILCASCPAQRIKRNIGYERIDAFTDGSAISGQSALKINRPSS